MEKMTRQEIKELLYKAKKNGLTKPRPIKIPKNIKYDRITIAKQRTWERLGIWLD